MTPRALATGTAALACPPAVAAPAPDLLPVTVSISDRGFGLHRIGIGTERVALTIRNAGCRPHDLVLVGSVHGAPVNVATAPIAPGTSVALTLRLPFGA